MGFVDSRDVLVAQTDIAGEHIALKLSGSAESEALDQLRAALDGVHEKAAGKRSKVAVDVRELEFATSSCLKAFAAWLVRVSELPSGYPVTFISSRRHSWQKRSLGALAACAPDLVTVENDPA